MKIKVCGLKYGQNINEVSVLSPDYMGFIFYRSSPRYADQLSTDVLKALPKEIIKTAVFVDEVAEMIDGLIDKYGFDAIQLHGNESPEFCASFKTKVKVIKAFGINSDFDFRQLEAYADKVDYFLFDTKTDIYGGSGKVFNWDILRNYDLNVPFFLSGGLSNQNLQEITALENPFFYGVDLNSKFETAPAQKSIEELQKAFYFIKQAYTNEVRS